MTDYTCWGTSELIEKIYQLESQLDETYNGWTNYETWRVQLEIMDGYDWSDYDAWQSISDIADQIKEIVEETVLTDADGLVADYASAFLNNVNYYEIAQHAVDQYPNLLAKTIK